jgi:hypothetical protein
MSSAIRSQEHDGLHVSHLSDFEILHRIADLVSKEQSVEARTLLLEMIRRFASSRAASGATGSKHSILGMARWGDAKRVYDIFGIKRGPLDRLRRSGKIESRSLDDVEDEQSPSSMRAKRLYDLVTIEKFLRSPAGTKFAKDSKPSPRSEVKTNSASKNHAKRWSISRRP